MTDKMQGRGAGRGAGKGARGPGKPPGRTGGGAPRKFGDAPRPAGGKRPWTPRPDAERQAPDQAARPKRRAPDFAKSESRGRDDQRPDRKDGPRPAYGKRNDGKDARPFEARAGGGRPARSEPRGRGDQRSDRQDGPRPAYSKRNDGKDARPFETRAGDGRPARSEPRAPYRGSARATSEDKRPFRGSRPDRPPRPAPAAPVGDAAERGPRIAKLMARAGLCSRRDAETWIAEGRVAVNGIVLTGPALKVGPSDSVVVDGKELPAIERTRLFLFHKPRGFVTTDHDPDGRATIFDHLREQAPELPRVVSVGRLDINTEGLLLLTNDGGLARVLELPATGWLRRYRVRANGVTDQAVLDGLRAGITLDGVDYAGIEATLDRVQGANSWMTIGLREGKNREIKRVLEHLGLAVNRLIRMSFGPFQLNDLPEGSVEEVRTRVLRDQLGISLAEAAEADFDSPTAAERVALERARPPRDPAPRPREDRAPRDRNERPPRDRTAAPARGREERAPRSDDRPARTREDRPPRGRDAPPSRMRDDRSPRSHDARGPQKRSGDRPRGEPDTRPERGRPQKGTRPHVSTARAAAEQARESGPRLKITRGETADRKGRAVAVERVSKSGASSADGSSRNARRFGAARRDAEAGPREAKRAFKPKTGGERPPRGPAGGDRPPRRR